MPGREVLVELVPFGHHAAAEGPLLFDEVPRGPGGDSDLVLPEFERLVFDECTVDIDFEPRE